MKKEEFIALAHKYRYGQCSCEEQDLFEKVYEDLMHEDSLAPEWDEKIKEHQRQRILSRIELKRSAWKKGKAWSYQMYWRAAASILLVASIGLSIYFLNFQESGSNYLTESTSFGERSIIQLKDGSVVTLNSKSKLSYPEEFSDERREVVLEGEAFFEVQRDVDWPFIVRSGDVMTTVMGTSFNIRAFDEEHVEVTVASGKVHVSAVAFDKEVLLIKDEQAKYDKLLNDITTQNVDSKSYTSWVSRSLEFDMMPFIEVIKVLERTYNVELKVRNTDSNKCLIWGKYKDEELISVLHGLKLVVNFDFHVIEEDVIAIEGKGCII